MKSIRKSLNGNKDSLRNQISTPLPSVSKPASAVTPPQKVIRATADYRPQAPQELSFKKGDFFYVLRDVDNRGSWYEAHNPISGARGLVPKALFEEFSKTSVSSRTSQGTSLGNINIPTGVRSSDVPLTPKSPTKSQVFYAIVLHDFEAERADELDAKRGDAITVVAQSNREWFVAKPIGRLGRPGLIPVSFVEIHDPTTGRAVPDVNALMDRGDLPKVEDWKRAMFHYKQNSIALGVIDAPTVPNSPFVQTQPPLPPSSDPSIVEDASTRKQSAPSVSSGPENADCLPEGILLYAEAVSFHYEMEEYWFRVNAVFQPYPPPGQDSLPNSKQLILFRVYNDFYDFQVSLLDSFPREAGRQPPNPRMLPYMPGPAQNVNDQLTATRRAELDDYLHSLCDLNKAGAKYILEHKVVREFLSLKPGDVENESDPKMEEIEALFATDDDEQYGNDAEYDEVRDTLGKMKVEDDRRSEGSEYGEDEGYAPSPQHRTYDRHPYARADERKLDDNNLRLHAHAQNHHRNGSTSSFNRTPSPYTSNSRSNSPNPDRIESRRDSDYSYRHSTGKTHNASSPSISSVRSTNAPTGGRTRSHSNANNPPISAANSQTAFVKIKIFDRVADDLIAIRVHPLVTHSELMDKVQTRLGGEVSNLRFRDSVNNAFVALDNDSQLRAWMEGTDKHVLYAD
ncbi:scd2/ral3 [Lentinula aff. detonsa]|uniref:Scd2/ral3 n=1 Tax=Lentinula aff. detonsa TaxID=2804958 RepID=A0AA38NT63_9AGAR|nr:scd2/ral3 [Lentinula aff. detonsa]KAJ3802723.1 scd2/ral3 [Lentinula aff. detonsa]